MFTSKGVYFRVNIIILNFLWKQTMMNGYKNSAILMNIIMQQIHTSRHPTKNVLAFVQLETRTNCYKYSFFQGTIGEWNNIPENIVQLNCDKFNATITEFLIK